MKKRKWQKIIHLEKHPSYGYATQEQIKQLETLGIGPDRDKILREIEEQNKYKGRLA